MPYASLWTAVLADCWLGAVVTQSEGFASQTGSFSLWYQVICRPRFRVITPLKGDCVLPLWWIQPLSGDLLLPQIGDYSPWRVPPNIDLKGWTCLCLPFGGLIMLSHCLCYPVPGTCIYDGCPEGDATLVYWMMPLSAPPNELIACMPIPFLIRPCGCTLDCSLLRLMFGTIPCVIHRGYAWLYPCTSALLSDLPKFTAFHDALWRTPPARYNWESSVLFLFRQSQSSIWYPWKSSALLFHSINVWPAEFVNSLV